MEYRSYTSRAAAQKALKVKGLNLLPVRYDLRYVENHPDRRVIPVVLVELVEDRRYVEEIGFKAEVRATDFGPNVSVTLHPTVQAGSRDEIAKIESFLPQTVEPVAVLDRPLGGTKYWKTEELSLV